MKIRFTHPMGGKIVNQSIKTDSKNYKELPNGDFSYIFDRYDYTFMLERLGGEYIFALCSAYGDPYDNTYYDYGFNGEKVWRFEIIK